MYHTIKAMRRPRLGVKLAISCGVTFVALGAWASSASAGTLCTQQTFFPSGTSQRCVRDAQGLLDSIKAHAGAGLKQPKPLITLTQDGIYGPQTKLGITNFQYDSNHSGTPFNPVVVDGILGPATWNKICVWEGFLTATPSGELNIPSTSLAYWNDSGCYLQP